MAMRAVRGARTVAQRRQAGVSILSVVVTLLVASILVLGAARAALELSATQGGTSDGQALNQINKALGAFVTDSARANAIRTGGTISGVANPMEPTVAELQALGLLSGNMRTTPSGSIT